VHGQAGNVGAVMWWMGVRKEGRERVERAGGRELAQRAEDDMGG
jgi:hypothetical protein